MSEKLARRIAQALFTNGAGERAAFLRMTALDGTFLGGWSERAALDLIQAALAKAAGPWMNCNALARWCGRSVSSLSRTLGRNGGEAPGLEIERRAPRKTAAPSSRRHAAGKIVRVRFTDGTGTVFRQWLGVVAVPADRSEPANDKLSESHGRNETL